MAGFFGGVKTPPYSTNGQGSVGAHSVRPCDLTAARDYGIAEISRYTGKATIPQSASFTQGSHFLYPHRVYFGPGGVNRRGAKKR